jgi:hypothetical protein
MLLKTIFSKEKLKIITALVIICIAVGQRIQFFDQSGKDIYAYEKALGDFFTGVNPYQWTIQSFSNPDDPGNHGFAYLPGMIFLFAPFHLLSLISGIPDYILWKIPILLADIGVGLLLFSYFYKKSWLALTAALLLWFFNPYAFLKDNYTYTEPLTIFFMLLSLKFLEKDDVLSGTFYALSILFKTFPYILFPLFLIKAKKMHIMLTAMAITALAFSFPFILGWSNLLTFLQGSIFIHSERFVQGRPFLFYISYYYNVELFQIIPFWVYTVLASFSGWILVLIAYYIVKIKDKYILALIPFLTFYLFTPVFNRTYFIWFVPVFIIAVYNLFEKRKIIFYYLTLFAYFIFAYWYLLQWKDGFHIWHP